ncbi:MAG: WYL domain-containing protein [Clostridiales bacterium]|nr:WYL domain-containing protein [Clostridiales bacterium]MBR5975837.1 WYL domain-containing protein [Clostridiales bacterium]
MANVENARDRLLCVLNILMQETDAENGLTIGEITQKLRDYGYEPDRKTLYADFRSISDRFAYVEKSSGNVPRYYIAERSFEVEEIMVLTDAVESAGFMTQKKKEELIKKLKGLTSLKQANELNAQIHYIGRHHSTNNDYIYTVSAIRKALSEGHPVTFKYLDMDFEKGPVYKHDSLDYILHPIAMAWNNGFYYCIGTRPEQSPEGEKDKPRQFRIDRMKFVEVKEEIKLAPPPKDFDVAKYLEATFSMYGAKPEKILLRFEKRLLQQFYDHFDQNIKTFQDPEKKDCVRANVEVGVGPTFYAWISTYAGGFTILEPKRVRDAYHEHLRSALES